MDLGGQSILGREQRVVVEAFSLKRGPSLAERALTAVAAIIATTFAAVVPAMQLAGMTLEQIAAWIHLAAPYIKFIPVVGSAVAAGVALINGVVDSYTLVGLYKEKSAVEAELRELAGLGENAPRLNSQLQAQKEAIEKKIRLVWGALAINALFFCLGAALATSEALLAWTGFPIVALALSVGFAVGTAARLYLLRQAAGLRAEDKLSVAFADLKGGIAPAVEAVPANANPQAVVQHYLAQQGVISREKLPGGPLASSAEGQAYSRVIESFETELKGSFNRLFQRAFTNLYEEVLAPFSTRDDRQCSPKEVVGELISGKATIDAAALEEEQKPSFSTGAQEKYRQVLEDIQTQLQGKALEALNNSLRRLGQSVQAQQLNDEMTLQQLLEAYKAAKGMVDDGKLTEEQIAELSPEAKGQYTNEIDQIEGSLQRWFEQKQLAVVDSLDLQGAQLPTEEMTLQQLLEAYKAAKALIDREKKNSALLTGDQKNRYEQKICQAEDKLQRAISNRLKAFNESLDRTVNDLIGEANLPGVTSKAIERAFTQARNAVDRARLSEEAQAPLEESQKNNYNKKIAALDELLITTAERVVEAQVTAAQGDASVKAMAEALQRAEAVVAAMEGVEGDQTRILALKTGSEQIREVLCNWIDGRLAHIESKIDASVAPALLSFSDELERLERESPALFQNSSIDLLRKEALQRRIIKRLQELRRPSRAEFTRCFAFQTAEKSLSRLLNAQHHSVKDEQAAFAEARQRVDALAALTEEQRVTAEQVGNHESCALYREFESRHRAASAELDCFFWEMPWQCGVEKTSLGALAVSISPNSIQSLGIASESIEMVAAICSNPEWGGFEKAALVSFLQQESNEEAQLLSPRLLHQVLKNHPASTPQEQAFQERIRQKLDRWKEEESIRLSRQCSMNPMLLEKEAEDEEELFLIDVTANHFFKERSIEESEESQGAVDKEMASVAAETEAENPSTSHSVQEIDSASPVESVNGIHNAETVLEEEEEEGSQRVEELFVEHSADLLQLPEETSVSDPMVLLKEPETEEAEEKKEEESVGKNELSFGEENWNLFEIDQVVNEDSITDRRDDFEEREVEEKDEDSLLSAEMLEMIDGDAELARRLQEQFDQEDRLESEAERRASERSFESVAPVTSLSSISRVAPPAAVVEPTPAQQRLAEESQKVAQQQPLSLQQVLLDPLWDETLRQIVVPLARKFSVKLTPAVEKEVIELLKGVIVQLLTGDVDLIAQRIVAGINNSTSISGLINKISGFVGSPEPTPSSSATLPAGNPLPKGASPEVAAKVEQQPMEKIIKKLLTDTRERLPLFNIVEEIEPILTTIRQACAKKVADGVSAAAAATTAAAAAVAATTAAAAADENGAPTEEKKELSKMDVEELLGHLRAVGGVQLIEKLLSAARAELLAKNQAVANSKEAETNESKTESAKIKQEEQSKVAKMTLEGQLLQVLQKLSVSYSPESEPQRMALIAQWVSELINGFQKNVSKLSLYNIVENILIFRDAVQLIVRLKNLPIMKVPMIGSSELVNLLKQKDEFLNHYSALSEDLSVAAKTLGLEMPSDPLDLRLLSEFLTQIQAGKDTPLVQDGAASGQKNKKPPAIKDLPMMESWVGNSPLTKLGLAIRALNAVVGKKRQEILAAKDILCELDEYFRSTDQSDLHSKYDEVKSSLRSAARILQISDVPGVDNPEALNAFLENIHKNRTNPQIQPLWMMAKEGSKDSSFDQLRRAMQSYRELPKVPEIGENPSLKEMVSLCETIPQILDRYQSAEYIDALKQSCDLSWGKGFLPWWLGVFLIPGEITLINNAIADLIADVVLQLHPPQREEAKRAVSKIVHAVVRNIFVDLFADRLWPLSKVSGAANHEFNDLNKAAGHLTALEEGLNSYLNPMKNALLTLVVGRSSGEGSPLSAKPL